MAPPPSFRRADEDYLLQLSVNLKKITIKMLRKILK
jgi:hypothetical protein